MSAVAVAAWPSWPQRIRAIALAFSRADGFPESTAESKSLEGGRTGEPDPDQQLADLALRFSERLTLFAARRLRDRNAAEDVAQEALRRTLEALRAGRIENELALPGFLYKTAENICLHSHRSTGRQSRAFAIFGRSRAADQDSAEDDPLTSLIGEERRIRVQQALERLEPEDRELLDMAYAQELDAAEIGRRLSATPGAVRVRKHRAIRRLAALLGRSGLGNEEGSEGT